MEKIYKQIGEVELALNMYVPNNWTANDRRAAILFFFGGGWMGGTVQQFKPQCEYFAAQGMVAFTAGLQGQVTTWYNPLRMCGGRKGCHTMDRQSCQ